MAWLIALDGALLGQRFSLKSPCLVGRGPYNHVVLDDMRISRQHSAISPEQGGYVVQDLNSINGTFVNDEQVRRAKLRREDVVRFGPFSFRFTLDEDLERAQPVSQLDLFETPTLSALEALPQIIDTLDAAAASNSRVHPGLHQLEDAYRRVQTLNAFIRAVATTLDTTELLDRILANVLEIFPSAGLATIYLDDRATGGTMMPRLTLPRTEKEAPRFALATQIHEEVVGRRHAVLSSPAWTFEGEQPQPTGGLTMYAPMLYRDQVPGVLRLDGILASGELFAAADLDLLTGIAAHAAMALRNAGMHRQSLEQERLREDLLLAEQIQKSFLPRRLPSVAGMEFVTEYRPAYQVGGDLYDVFWLDEDRIGMFIGDVSGKGISAALLMARVASDLRVAALSETEPARVMERVNQELLAREQHDIFVTGIYLTLDIHARQLVLANAGHLPPLVRHRAGGALDRIEEGTSTALGIFGDARYEQTRFSLHADDTLLLCTDGVVEATDVKGQQFGFERLEASLARGSSRPGDLAKRLLADIRAHVGDAPQADDLTMVVCGLPS